MADTERQQQDKRLELVGRIIREGVEDNGLNVSQAAKKWDLARSSLNELIKGADKPMLWGRVGIALGFPSRFLRAVADGDEAQIIAMDDLKPQMRVWVLGQLAEIAKPTPAARRPRKSG